MKSWIFSFILAFGSLSAMSKASPQTGVENIGVRTLKYEDAERKRPVVVEVWYPTQKTGPIDLPNDVWVHPPEIRDGDLSSRLSKYPLIVMSHGHGGDRRDRTWLVESLVRNGYVVASIEHHGSSWRTYSPLLSLRFWDRAQDISFAITHILKDPTLRIDREQIGFVGYSLGGMTGLLLGGAKAQNVKEILQQQHANHKDIDLALVEKIDFSEAQADFADPRIKAIALISPATFVFPPDSLQKVTAPVALIATEGDEVLPHKDHAQRLITYLAPSKLKVLSDQVSHYAFLNRVSDLEKGHLPPEMRPSPIESSRTDIHKEAAAFITSFFQENLKKEELAVTGEKRTSP